MRATHIMHISGICWARVLLACWWCILDICVGRVQDKCNCYSYGTCAARVPHVCSLLVCCSYLKFVCAHMRAARVWWHVLYKRAAHMPLTIGASCCTYITRIEHTCYSYPTYMQHMCHLNASIKNCCRHGNQRQHVYRQTHNVIKIRLTIQCSTVTTVMLICSRLIVRNLLWS